ncbi:MAG: YIP1 family protein [Treponema sp.]|nr:YIP1 family protein [Treponema sp.]
MKKIAAIIFFTATSGALAVFPQSTTVNFAANRSGMFVPTQDGYLPDRNITGIGLNRPENITFGNNDILYIADTGNRRIVLFDVNSGNIVREIRYEGFGAPRGIFVTPDDMLYVADSIAGAVFIFNPNDEIIKTISAPRSIAFGDTPFAPVRIGVDPRGSMYIIGEGVYNGIIHLSGEGEFLGFFASNETALTFIQFLQNIFFTERQKQGLLDRLPLTFSNVFADPRGIVYSVSMGRDIARTGEAIKKYDMAGRNMLKTTTTMSLTDITVDRYGNIFTTSTEGWIQVNAADGEEIFFFGAGHLSSEDIAGWFTNLISIAVSSHGHIWTLDGTKAFLQSYTPTEYTQSIYRAQQLFNEGHYIEAGIEWNNVLRFNQMSVLAHNGLGKSWLYQEEYEKARHEFIVAGNREFYSQAFWETRNMWLLNNMSFILTAFIVLFTGLFIVKNVDKKQIIKTGIKNSRNAVMNAQYIGNILFAFSVARRPLDSYYYLKRKEKGSVRGAAVNFLLFFAAYMIFQTSKGFIVQFAEIEDMDFGVIIGGFLGLYLLFIICNYLVTSINDGEGGFFDIFKLVSYAMFPLSVTLLAVTVISHVLTENEVFLLVFMLIGGFAWSGILLWLGLQEVHNYSFTNTFKSLIFTALFMLIALVVLFNMAILFSQFAQFIESFVREAYANITGMY